MLLKNSKAADIYERATDVYAKSAVPFPPSDWKYVLRLLGLVIVANGKTLREETDIFHDAVNELRVVIDPSLCITRHMNHDWFELNRPVLEDVIESASFDKFLYQTLAPIKSMPHKLDVISCMVRIAVSNGDYSNLEKSLINKTCLYWKHPEQLARYRRISQGVFLDADEL